MDEERAFDRAFARRTVLLSARPERDFDREFLIDLFVQCSPLAVMLPLPLLRQQAQMKLDAHSWEHPQAMGRIVESEGRPIGRILIDWTCPDRCHGVDIAVLPESRGSGAGLHMLRSWLEVADATGRLCELQVLHDNPAASLYFRLGFTLAPNADPDAPSLKMSRLPSHCRS